MWQIKETILEHDVYKFELLENNIQLTYQEVIEAWQNDVEFRKYYFSILQNVAFEAFFWENPPVTTDTISQPYEFVLVNSPQLSKVSADIKPFQEKFQKNSSVISFENLGKDAELIVPCPIASQNIYAHLATFIRNAPETQKHDLFISIATSLKSRLNNEPIWLSTSGLGVYWLHIRLDKRPKYYSYLSYRQYVK